jgi:hypothetical protein
LKSIGTKRTLFNVETVNVGRFVTRQDLIGKKLFVVLGYNGVGKGSALETAKEQKLPVYEFSTQGIIPLFCYVANMLRSWQAEYSVKPVEGLMWPEWLFDPETKGAVNIDWTNYSPFKTVAVNNDKVAMLMWNLLKRISTKMRHRDTFDQKFFECIFDSPDIFELSKMELPYVAIGMDGIRQDSSDTVVQMSVLRENPMFASFIEAFPSRYKSDHGSDLSDYDEKERHRDPLTWFQRNLRAVHGGDYFAASLYEMALEHKVSVVTGARTKGDFELLYQLMRLGVTVQIIEIQATYSAREARGIKDFHELRVGSTEWELDGILAQIREAFEHRVLENSVDGDAGFKAFEGELHKIWTTLTS